MVDAELIQAKASARARKRLWEAESREEALEARFVELEAENARLSLENAELGVVAQMYRRHHLSATEGEAGRRE